MSSLKIVNVVATANLKQHVDIETAGLLKDFLHDSEIYGGRVAYFKSKAMNGKVTIFPSGKLISVGARSVEEAFNNFTLALNALLENKLVKPILSDMKVRNIVSTVNFKKTIDIDNISLKLNAIYEPQQFSGAILKFETPKLTVLLFASGKAVITGAKNLESVNGVISLLSNLLFS